MFNIAHLVYLLFRRQFDFDRQNKQMGAPAYDQLIVISNKRRDYFFLMPDMIFSGLFSRKTIL